MYYRKALYRHFHLEYIFHPHFYCNPVSPSCHDDARLIVCGMTRTAIPKGRSGLPHSPCVFYSTRIKPGMVTETVDTNRKHHASPLSPKMPDARRYRVEMFLYVYWRCSLCVDANFHARRGERVHKKEKRTRRRGRDLLQAEYCVIR